MIMILGFGDKDHSSFSNLRECALFFVAFLKAIYHQSNRALAFEMTIITIFTITKPLPRLGKSQLLPPKVEVQSFPISAKEKENGGEGWGGFDLCISLAKGALKPFALLGFLGCSDVHVRSHHHHHHLTKNNHFQVPVWG